MTDINIFKKGGFWRAVASQIFLEKILRRGLVWGHISVANLNPAVTLALLVSFQIRPLRCVCVCVRACYILAQMLGAVATSAFENGYSPSELLGPWVILVHLFSFISQESALKKHFVIEFLATLQLIVCVIAVTDKRVMLKTFTPLAIGLSVGLGYFAAISFTGCGTNPARSFGPVLIRKGIQNTWACGGIAATIYNTILYPRTPNSRMRRIVLLHGAEDEAENKISIQSPRHCVLLFE
uniref:Aquaporin 1a (Colton blood group), tandem duplicate 2 n=1 Tax=Seriola dumerili TaxID=41447 RepID=A0A3B4UXF0_SERDU